MSAELDRATARRKEPAWLEESLARRGRLVPLHRGKTLLDAAGAALFVDADAARPSLDAADPEILRNATFLGVGTDGADPSSAPAYFAIDLGTLAGEDEALAALGSPPEARWTELRFAPQPIAAPDLDVLLYARALEQWRRQQRFCHRCGAPTRIAESGHVAICTREGDSIFPRTDAAMIVLTIDAAADRVLLGRQPSWPPGMYSTLAGFVEAGESLEAAVVREVREESGVLVTRVRYAGSQPWPFPQSLMLGVYADALTTEIRLDDELEDARWFTRDALRDLEQRQGRFIRIETMAMRLIRGWLAGPV